MRAGTPVTDQRVGYPERDPFIVIRYQEKRMNKDQVKGRAEEVKGKMKQATGKAVGDRELEHRGRIQKAGGKIQAGYGDLKKDVKDSA